MLALSAATKESTMAYTFDCFECAIHMLAPACGHCGCRVLGHGVEENGAIYCCANCARAMGKLDLRDRGTARARERPVRKGVTSCAANKS